MERSMDSQISEQLAIGVGAIITGLAAWLLPYRWNIFRLRRVFGDSLPDRVSRMVPKIIGTIALVIGILILVGTLTVGKLK